MNTHASLPLKGLVLMGHLAESVLTGKGALFTRIVIGEGRSKTEIIVNQSNRELLLELIKKALKVRS